MSKTQLRTEHDLNQYWKIISEDGMDSQVYAEAMQWLNAHSTDIKQLDNLITSSERKARRHRDFSTLEDADCIRTLSYDPEAVLPAEVRHLLYDDMRWFNRAAYMPKNSDEDEQLYLDKKIVEGLHELTEQQREVLFRTVINGESTESVAEDYGCTSRNIRDIRSRAIWRLQKKVSVRRGEGRLPATRRDWLILIALMLAALVFLIKDLSNMLRDISNQLAPPDDTLSSGISIILGVGLFALYFVMRRWHTIRSLRHHWADLNGTSRKQTTPGLRLRRLLNRRRKIW